MRCTIIVALIALLPVVTIAQPVPPPNGNAGVSDNASHTAGVTLSFLNFAALKAFNMSSVDSHLVTATTAGYMTAGDGGASIYDWDASSTRRPDNIFFVKPNVASAGRWVLRLPGSSIHPEQAGARCDGVTDDAAALNALTDAINNAPESMDNGIRIDLNPNRFCLIASASWRTPNGSTVSGTINPINDAVGFFDPFRSGIVHPASVRLEIGRGGKLKDMAVLRQNMPMNPRTLQIVMTQVMTWYRENGAISNVAPEGGSSGAGCSIGDKMQVPGGFGNAAWIEVSSIGAGGAVTGFKLLDPGAYMSFPASPTSIAGEIAGPATAYTCTSLPKVTFTAGTPRSVGVEQKELSALENVFVAGFNLGIASTGGGTRMDHVAFDDANGIDISHNGENGVYRDLAGGEIWSSSATHQGVGSFGVVSITKIASGGTGNQVGDVLTVQAGTCDLPPQITVDRVADGEVTAAHLSTYGDCTPALPKHNPATLSNLHGGTPATADLLWATFDYRPGTAIYVHDQCDGCMFSDVGAHGWQIGFDVSNVWAISATTLALEPANFSIGPAPPPMSTFGLRTRNFVQGMFFSVHADGFSVGAELDQCGCQHETLPYHGCGRGVSDNDYNGSISLSGGTFGFPNEGSSYGLDLGPYSRGIVSDIQISTGGLVAPINVQANVYGWVLRDIMTFGGEETHWLTIDPTSKSKVFANAVRGSDRETMPLIVMGGLPTSSAGLPSGSLWNNGGVVNIVP